MHILGFKSVNVSHNSLNDDCFEKAVTEYCPCGTQETTFSFNGINPKSGHNEGKTPKNL